MQQQQQQQQQTLFLVQVQPSLFIYTVVYDMMLVRKIWEEKR
jgi:hypothetical protein